MFTIKKSMVIHSPIQKVFDYLNDPTVLPEYWPNMVGVRDVQKLSNGGVKFHYAYKMAGMRIEGTSEDIEVIPGQKMVSKTSGGIDGLVTWELAVDEGGTRVAGTFEYAIPLPVIGKLAEAAIVKMNEQDIQKVFNNLKARLEG